MMYCWIIPVITGLLCALLGYLLGKICSNKKVKECEHKNKNLKERLKECGEKLENQALQFEKQSFTSKQEQKKEVPLIFDADAAKAVFGKKIKANDLTVVEGIGPKIKELFHSFDVNTWGKLSETSVERCQEILNSGGERYKFHNPGTWSKQAKLAFEGKWKELLEWQDKLDGGLE